jgi:hypothetical protein
MIRSGNLILEKERLSFPEFNSKLILSKIQKAIRGDSEESPFFLS